MPQKEIKKVLFDARSAATDQPTGVGYYTKGVVEALSMKYPHVNFIGHYFANRSNGNSNLPHGQNISYKRSRFIPEKIVNQLRRMGINLPLELFARTRADIVMFPAYIRQPSLFNSPTVITIHDLAYINNPKTVSDKNRADLIKLMPKSIRKSSLILTVSEQSKKEILRHYNVNPDKILVHGLPPVQSIPVSIDTQNETLNHFGISKKFFLFTGTLEPRKNIVWLINAFLAMPEDILKNYQLVIAGKMGWNNTEILKALEKIKNRKEIILTGYVNETQRAALFSSAEALLLASIEEGFGMPILEAASYGKPAILSDIPIFHEVAGKGALYFTLNDIHSFTNVINEFISKKGLSEKLVHNANENLIRYNWDGVAGKIMNEFTNFL